MRWCTSGATGISSVCLENSSRAPKKACVGDGVGSQPMKGKAGLNFRSRLRKALNGDVPEKVSALALGGDRSHRSGRPNNRVSNVDGYLSNSTGVQDLNMQTHKSAEYKVHPCHFADGRTRPRL